MPKKLGTTSGGGKRRIYGIEKKMIDNTAPK
jgi:hypothetical protein